MFNPPPQGPPWADHPRTTSFPSLVFALPWAKISRRSHHPALRYPQPYKQTKKQQQKTKSKLNITPNATLYGEIKTRVLAAALVFLSRVSTLTRDIDIANLSVRPFVCLSVRPSVRYVPVSDENGLTYRHSFSPYGSPITLVLPASNIFTKFRWSQPLRGR